MKPLNFFLTLILSLCTLLCWGQSYHTGDVTVINNMIANNGLNAKTNNPSSWNSFLTWTLIGNSFRITSLTANSTLKGDLTLSDLAELNYLHVETGKLTKLNVSGLTKLVTMFCSGQQLTSLNIKGCTALEYLECNGNQLTSLDVSGFEALANLECAGNKLTSLNVSGCKKLEVIECHVNQFTSLDMSGLTSLSQFICSSNLLTALNVKGCVSLRTLECENNYLASLDLSGLKSVSVRCFSNPLSMLTTEDGSVMNVTASPTAGGTVTITRYSDRVRVNARANTGYTFYDWTVITSVDETQNYALSDETDVRISGGVKVTMTANFSGGPAIIPVTSVSLDQRDISLNIGETSTLHATVKPDNATNRTVSWQSSNEGVATVTNSGQVKGIGAGTATIAATADGKSATCNVIVNEGTIPVNTVSLDKSTISLKEGETSTLQATVKPDNATNRTVTWQSSNEGVATVTNAGQVKGIGTGTATITATAGGKTATCSVTVTAASQAEFEVVSGVLVKYNCTGGNVVIPGNLGITAIGNMAFLKCEKITSVKLPDKLVSIGERAFFGCTNLTAVDIPKSVKSIGQWAFFQCPALRDVTVYWDKASDIPDVNAFYAADIASATLHTPPNMKPDYQATYGWENFGSYPLEAENGGNGNENGGLSETITLNHWYWWLKPSETLVLSANITPASSNNQPMTWKSTNPAVATVTSMGQNATIKAFENGSANIIVSTANGAMSDCFIIVNNNPGWAMYANSDYTGSSLVGEKVQLYVRIVPENTNVINDLSSLIHTWKSENPFVATVSSEGLVTAIAKGKALIKNVFSFDGAERGGAGFTITVIDGHTYNSSDISALKSFVSQENNYKALGLNSDWEKDTKWYEKIKGVVWRYSNSDSEMRIEEIDWCYYNITGRLDATSFSNLKTLKVSYTNLTEINVKGLQNLNHLACSHIGLLRYLEISNNPKLEYLFCSGNIFSFNTLPSVDSKYAIYRYIPQLTINVPTSPGKEVDLTDYLHNNKTVFKWYRQSNLSVQLTDIVEKSDKGKFVIPVKYAVTELVCLITNSDFPDFTGDNAMKCRVHVCAVSGVVVADQPAVNANNNEGTVDLNVLVPSEATTVLAEMKINFSSNIRLNKKSLEDYMAKGDYTVKKLEEISDAFSSSWLLSFFYDWMPMRSSMLRSSVQSFTLLTIPFDFDKQLTDGKYPITFSNVNLDFDNGIRYVEPKLTVSLTINPTGIETVSDRDIHVYAYDNMLYLNSPVAEDIHIYLMSGTLLFHAEKPAGIIRIPVNNVKGQIIIIRGYSGWVKKVMM